MAISYVIGNYGRTYIISKEPSIWGYDIGINIPKIGTYNYYWRINKKASGYVASMWSPIKGMVSVYKKYTLELDSLKKAVQYADRISEALTSESVENLYRTFGKRM